MLWPFVPTPTLADFFCGEVSARWLFSIYICFSRSLLPLFSSPFPSSSFFLFPLLQNSAFLTFSIPGHTVPFLLLPLLFVSELTLFFFSHSLSTFSFFLPDYSPPSSIPLSLLPIHNIHRTPLPPINHVPPPCTPSLRARTINRRPRPPILVFENPVLTLTPTAPHFPCHPPYPLRRQLLAHSSPLNIVTIASPPPSLSSCSLFVVFLSFQLLLSHPLRVFSIFVSHPFLTSISSCLSVCLSIKTIIYFTHVLPCLTVNKITKGGVTLPMAFPLYCFFGTPSRDAFKKQHRGKAFDIIVCFPVPCLVSNVFSINLPLPV